MKEEIFQHKGLNYSEASFHNCALPPNSTSGSAIHSAINFMSYILLYNIVIFIKQKKKEFQQAYNFAECSASILWDFHNEVSEKHHIVSTNEHTQAPHSTLQQLQQLESDNLSKAFVVEIPLR